MFFYVFLSLGNHFSFVCFTIFAGSLISEIYHFCSDLKSLFTVAECRLKSWVVLMETCMHTSRHKAQHYPLLFCSLYSPIKFFIILLITVLLVLESWSCFIFH